ncbi:MAG: NRDE family protein [Thermoanaerobaculia bacterium]|nr:NRDE family protein [Thermoanaerobaculia bacterium]
MCTATWIALPEPGSYELYFNRDESRARGRALPPARLGDHDDISVLAPRDADAGGSWIAANSRGVAVCLLNRYQDAERVAVPEDRRRSRGLLVLDLATSASVSEVARRLSRQELERYPAFTVLAAHPDQPPVSFRWTGSDLLPPEQPSWPVSSSGYDADAAARARRELWLEIANDRAGTPEQALELHRSHRPARGAVSPCMHRADASTVSLTVLRIESERIGMRYADGPPCTTLLGEPIWIPRQNASDS